MSSHAQIRGLACVMSVIAAGSYAVHSAPGSAAYLPSAGPAPLRFELAVANPASLANKIALPAVKPSADLSTHSPAVATATNVIAQATFVAGATNAQAAPVADGTSVSAVSPTPDTPPVTPEMVADFFSPPPAATNGVPVAAPVPVNVGFMPPSAQPATSRATYKVQ